VRNWMVRKLSVSERFPHTVQIEDSSSIAGWHSQTCSAGAQLRSRMAILVSEKDWPSILNISGTSPTFTKPVRR
jgi:hypothetical protein